MIVVSSCMGKRSVDPWVCRCTTWFSKYTPGQRSLYSDSVASWQRALELRFKTFVACDWHDSSNEKCVHINNNNYYKYIITTLTIIIIILFFPSSILHGTGSLPFRLFMLNGALEYYIGRCQKKTNRVEIVRESCP